MRGDATRRIRRTHNTTSLFMILFNKIIAITILFLIAVAYTIFLIGALTHDRKLVKFAIITLFILFTLLLITPLITLL